MQLTGSKTLTQLLSSQRWARFQVYGVLPQRSIRPLIVGEVEQVEFSHHQIEITCSRGALAIGQNAWKQYSDVWKTPTEPLIVQMIGPHRIALITPGMETITTVLFGEEDDGVAIEVFPGFTFGPIDLDAIVTTPHQGNATDRTVTDQY